MIDGAYGYQPPPNVTPPFNTLLTDGHILDTGDGDPEGNGAYQKNSGGNPNAGTVYVVAGHGGSDLGGSGGHPVMLRFDPTFGSVLLDINGATLTGQNLRIRGCDYGHLRYTEEFGRRPGHYHPAGECVGHGAGPGHLYRGGDGRSDVDLSMAAQ